MKKSKMFVLNRLFCSLKFWFSKNVSQKWFRNHFILTVKQFWKIYGVGYLKFLFNK